MMQLGHLGALRFFAARWGESQIPRTMPVLAGPDKRTTKSA